MLLLIVSIAISVSQVESLALESSSEIRSAQEELKGVEANYKGALFSFVPSINITGNIPSLSYYSDEIYYPSYPAPIDYWKRTNERLISTELSLALPFGGDASISYDVLKMGEFYNLYEDREYYEGNLTFSLKQPFLGTSSSWDQIKSLGRDVERAKRNLKKTERDVRRDVRRCYATIFVSEKIIKGIKEVGKLAEKGLEELEFLKGEGLIDEMEYLKSKGKLGLMLLKKMEIEATLRENREELKILTGLEDFIPQKPPRLDLKGLKNEPVPDIVFQLKTTEEEISSLNEDISRKKRGFAPSFEISGYLGLRGRNGEMESIRMLSKNRWGVSIGVNIPILNPPSFLELSALKHEKNALLERKKSLERKCEMERENILYKQVELKKRLDIAEDTYKASERALKEIPPEMLPLSDRLQLLDDYIQVMKSYRSILSEVLVLEVNFEEGMDE